MQIPPQELIENVTTQISDDTQANESVKKNLSTADIQAWLVSYLSNLLEIEPSQVSTTTSFERFGMDSSAIIFLTSDLGEWLGHTIDPTLAYDYPSIKALAQHLEETFQS